MTESYDVIVIGAGPAGYVAAIRCAQLGLHTAVIDDWLDAQGSPVLGGTCLNAGCIPSKALLDSSELYYRSLHESAEHGIRCDNVTVDIGTMMARKQRVVGTLTKGIATLFQANDITWLKGQGCLLDNKRVRFTPHEASHNPETLDASNIILASGSQPAELDAAPLDGERIIDSTGALELSEIPRRLGVIGAGVIGLELGSVWRRLGAEVVLLEAQDSFLPMVDEQISAAAFKQFTQQGLQIRLATRVVSTQLTDTEVRVHYLHGEDEQALTVDRLIVAVGRKPRSQNLFAPECNLLMDERGYVHVDEFCMTNLPGVYAIGDLVRGPMLAHKGAEEGVAVAESIAAGREISVDRNRIPSIVYTFPEIAWVGQTEQELRTLGNSIRTGMFPFAASGRAHAMEAPQGMAKIIADGETDQILGVHILGPWASELIAEAVLAMEFSASSEDIARTIHAHPTLSEALHEAALAVAGRAIHPGRRRMR
jgi:dihydrolipoamide dehydrogenase